MTSEQANNLIEWRVATGSTVCSECDEEIFPDERYSAYFDKGITGHAAQKFKIKRHYCQGCTEDLISSLVTATEDSQ